MDIHRGTFFVDMYVFVFKLLSFVFCLILYMAANLGSCPHPTTGAKKIGLGP